MKGDCKCIIIRNITNLTKYYEVRNIMKYEEYSDRHNRNI